MRQDSRNPAAHSPVDTGSASPTAQVSKKRKSTATGSRGVATLTPEQLAKKRANDREAQRAIRERTKLQIETLEHRIQELTAQQPYQELQAVLRQKDAIQAENDEIRRRLASILAIIQPVVGAQGLTDLATAAQTNLQFGLGPQANLFNPDHFEGQNGSIQNVSPDGSAMYPPSYPGVEAMGNTDRQWESSRHALDNQRANLQRNLELNDSERLSFNFLLDSTKRPSGPQSRHDHSSPSHHSVISASYSNQPQTSWTTLPKNLPPTCPLDGALLKFLHSRQQEAGNHGIQSSHSGPVYPSVSSLLNSASVHKADPLSQLMTDIINKFPGIAGLPEQIAILYLMFVMMRWMIYPTQENYERIPEWFTPRPSQLFTPHPAWIDYLQFPRMRDKLVGNYNRYPFENWFIPFTTGMSVNWPYEAVDCLLSTPENEEAMINPVFERHIMRLENWSLGPAFAEAYPELVDTTKIKTEPAQKNTERPP